MTPPDTSIPLPGHRRFNRMSITLLLALAGLGAAGCHTNRSFDADRMTWAEKHIDQAIDRGDIPGAVLLVGRGQHTLYRKAFGHRAIQPEKEPMTPDTVFDLASLSKVVGCATSVMLLIERGQVSPSDPVARYVPEFAANGKDKITVEQLLLHRGGLIPDNPLRDYQQGPEKAWQNIWQLDLIYPPGTDFRYTDVGYIVLAELVHRVDGRPLDRFAREEIFQPLGMDHTAYNPPPSWKPRCAPTEQREDRWMRGEVHDPRAYLLGGVAGHAGLFSTADDLASWCRMILADGAHQGRHVLSHMAVREMTRPRCLADGRGCRGYGFDVDTGYSSARGNLFEAGSTFGHTGFTGTMFWIDPAHDAFVIFLTNRVHPDGKGKVVDLRRRVVSAVAATIQGEPQRRPAPAPSYARAPRSDASDTSAGAAGADEASGNVYCGIDVLKRDGFKTLAGKKIAIITNHTGVDREGNRTIDLLVNAPDVHVQRLLSPEHGLFGVLDEKVGDMVDPATGLKVFSLYSQTRRPTPEMLEDIDAILFDIQDIGTRFYTYIATMGNAMEEAADHGIEMIVLDRPNPIRGLKPAGPISDEKYLGFTSFRRLPLVHAMTAGELALMFNDHHAINCRLTVVEMEGWRRSMWWDETGLRWINPSPNMRNLTQATLYPAIGLLEASNISVGRGTDQPFELFGAPWIDARHLAAALNQADLPGLRFVPIHFTPNASKFKDETCHGVYIVVTDRNAIQPARSGLTIAWHLHRLFKDDFDIDKVNRLLMNDEVLATLQKVNNPRRLSNLWTEPLREFDDARSDYLIYDE